MKSIICFLIFSTTLSLTEAKASTENTQSTSLKENSSQLVLKQGNNKVIVKKEDTSSSIDINQKTPVITDSALVPSAAHKIREAREKQEVATENLIMKSLEKQRLLDEQKRIDNLLQTTPPPPTQTHTQQPTNNIQQKKKTSKWLLGNKSFLSFGLGLVSYPRTTNIQSNKEHPSLFASFGGYNSTGNLMFDFLIYYSKHFSIEPKRHLHPHHHFGQKIDNVALAMGVKISPPSLGRAKPYIGGSVSLKFLRWDPYIDPHTGASVSPRYTIHKADTKWTQSFDIGPSLGADLALGERLGLNVDFRYHISVFHEREKKRYEPIRLDDMESFVGSINFRYYL